VAKQRQTDVNINYRVNTVEVDKATSLLNRASQSTDNLRKQTQQFSQAAGKSFQSASKYIEGMELELARLRQQIKLTNTQDTQRLAQLSAQYKSLKSQVDAYNKALFEQVAATKQAAQSSQNLAQSFGQVVSAVKLFVTASVAKEILDVNLSLAKLSGNVEGVERAFNRAFPNSVKLLEDLKTATHGTVTEFELMQRTLQATNLGVAVESLPLLFEFAATRAQQTGESVDYLVDSIVRGIGRKSILVLDNLGLSATRLREQFNGASLASQSVADVTKGVAEIARVELEKMGGYAETAATKVSQLTVAVEELKVAFAKKQEDKGNVINELITDITEGWTELIKGEQELAKEEAKRRAANQVDRIIQSKEFRDFKENQVAKVDLLFREFLERRNLIKIRQEEIAANEQTLRQRVQDVSDISPKELQQLRDRIKDQRLSLATLQESLPILIRYVKEIQKLGSPIEPKGLIEEVEEKLSSLGENLKKARTTDEIARINHELSVLEVTLKRLKDINVNDIKLFENIPSKSKALNVNPEGKSKDKNLVDRNQLVDVQEQLNKAGEQLFLVLPVTVKPQPYTDSDLQKAWDELQDEVFNSSLNNLGSLITSQYDLEVEGYNARINALRDFYDEQQLLAGDNERAKDELRLEEQRKIKELEKLRADREKKAALAGITVSTALGIMKVFAGEGTFADKIIKAGIVALEGLTQFSIASRARYYAKGEVNIKGPGTKTSDSIPAMLSRGESVMTADETQGSMGILKSIRAKKLNDKVLKEITSGRSGGTAAVGVNMDPVVNAINELKNSQPDIAKRANLIYEGKKLGDQYVRWIRSKSVTSNSRTI